MGIKMRLDKLLANMGMGSRKEVQKAAKQGLVSVNGQTIKKADMQVDPTADAILFCGQQVEYEPYLYLMMNKPAGYVSANEDRRDATVMELLPEPYCNMELFVAGRLDKDTEGLLLLTNNGVFSHNMLSPKKHVPKTYFVRVQGGLTEQDTQTMATGMTIDGGEVCRPGKLEILQSGAESEACLTIVEGKFHQVKRMFDAVGKPVLFLRRISMGGLPLDETLPLGGVKKLTRDEIGLVGADLGERA